MMFLEMCAEQRTVQEGRTPVRALHPGRGKHRREDTRAVTPGTGDWRRQGRAGAWGP